MNPGDSRPLKVMLLGDSVVGKTSLLIVLTNKPFPESNMSTIGVDAVTCYMEVACRTVRLQLWDTAGQENFRSIPRSYFRDSDGFVLVFDLTSVDSFNGLRVWIDQIKKESACVIKLVIGNKTDLADDRKVPSAKGAELAERLGAMYFETSAKTGQNVREAFSALCEQLLREKVPVVTEEPPPVKNPSMLKPVEKKKDTCPCQLI